MNSSFGRISERCTMEQTLLQARIVVEPRPPFLAGVTSGGRLNRSGPQPPGGSDLPPACEVFCIFVDLGPPGEDEKHARSAKTKMHEKKKRKRSPLPLSKLHPWFLPIILKHTFPEALASVYYYEIYPKVFNVSKFLYVWFDEILLFFCILIPPFYNPLGSTSNPHAPHHEERTCRKSHSLPKKIILCLH